MLHVLYTIIIVLVIMKLSSLLVHCGKFSQNGKFGQNGKFSQNGNFGQNGMSGQKGKVHLGPNVSSSAHNRGCVVNGSGGIAAI